MSTESTALRQTLPALKRTPSEPKRTPFYAAHCALNARLIDFNGWQMPLHYRSQLDEHRAVRGDAGLFDVSHMCIADLTAPAGSGAVRGLLHYAAANNIDKLTAPGRALYTCLLNSEGGVIDDLIIYRFGDDFFRLVVNAATADKDLAWLAWLNAERNCGVTIAPRRDLAILAAQGPNARVKVWQAIPATHPASEALKPFHAVRIPQTPFGELTVARTGYTGEDGFELIAPTQHALALWEQLIAAGVKPCGLGARDTLRVEAGMNLYGQDMDEQVSPLDAGLGWTVDLTSDRDFAGKSALLRDGQQHAFMGLVLRDQGGILRAHQKVITAHGDGEITSGIFSPSLNQSIGFARLPQATSIGDRVQVQIRDKALAASVVNLPFVRNGRALVS